VRGEAITVTLRTKYPCCGGGASFRATVDVPRELFDRQCPSCGQRYEVERKTLRQAVGIRMDQLAWTRMASVAIKVEHLTA
jgi:transcription elongation factor Elf1